jgi:hypothetical protein
MRKRLNPELLREVAAELPVAACDEDARQSAALICSSQRML